MFTVLCVPNSIQIWLCQIICLDHETNNFFHFFYVLWLMQVLTQYQTKHLDSKRGEREREKTYKQKNTSSLLMRGNLVWIRWTTYHKDTLPKRFNITKFNYLKLKFFLRSTVYKHHVDMRWPSASSLIVYVISRQISIDSLTIKADSVSEKSIHLSVGRPTPCGFSRSYSVNRKKENGKLKTND